MTRRSVYCAKYTAITCLRSSANITRKECLQKAVPLETSASTSISSQTVPLTPEKNRMQEGNLT
ncbi:hypothetical protein TELCIR_21496 [Teladorsagia circumcincta]|uniref:Uncharacterized protein n=1 Tax=Teladorsagia circumcincta TaxID=45464 RepID=A0A2G9TGM6_TELCI|nr:hypothetical protein TELCIR_21496 [Teladorsagia circumcincta]